MANRYWVGGTGTWNSSSTTNWSATSGGAAGASVPTSADAVFINGSSGTGTISVSGFVSALSIDFTGYTGTFTGPGGVLACYGSVTCPTGGTFTTPPDLELYTNTATLTTNGKSFGNITVRNNATVTLGSAVTADNAFYMYSGSLTTSNFNITAYSFYVQPSGSCTLTLGSSTITLTSTWEVQTPASVTLNANTSTISIAGNGGVSGTFRGGGKTYNAVSMTKNPLTSNIIYDANTFSTLTLDAPATTGVASYAFDANQTITTMVCSGTSVVNRVLLRSSVYVLAVSLTVTTWSSISDVDFQDISLNSSRSGTRLGNRGGNTNVTFSAAKTVYWNLSGAQNWSATGWATSSGGTPAVNNFPLAQDTAVFDNTGSITGTITVDDNWGVGTLNLSARTTAATLSFANSFDIMGDLTLGTGITTTGNAVQYFSGRSTTQNITSNGQSFSPRVTFRAVSGTVKLLDAFIGTSTSALPAAFSTAVSSNTLNTNGFNVTIAGTASLGFGTVTLGSSTVTFTNSGNVCYFYPFTVTANTATFTFTSASSKTFNCSYTNTNGLTVNQGGAGALVFGDPNGTFYNLTNTYGATGATTITFAAGQPQYFLNWTASGTAGKLLTINSTTPGTQATISKSSGIVSASYLSIQDSNATGGASWYAGTTSTNVSNNTGWLFTDAPLATSNFLLMFS